MFAVFNKDVKSPAYVSVCMCLLIIPLLANAHDPSVINPDAVQSTSGFHESYEDYLNKRELNSVHEKSRKTIIKSAIRKIKGPSADKQKISTSKKRTFTRYTVQKKDTLTRIAKKFSTTVYAIQKYNRLRDQHSIKVGMVLKILGPLNACPAKQACNTNDSAQRNDRPRFRWPLSHVVDYKNDGLDGVKSIGIIITGVPGSHVLSSAEGIVKKIGRMRGFGKYIVINHAGRFNTVYANISEIRVSEGDTVQRGDIIGRIHVSDKKLHFQIDLEGKPENPLTYLPAKKI